MEMTPPRGAGGRVPETQLAEPLVLRPRRGLVEGPVGTEHLEPKVMDTLRHLVARPGRTVLREELLDAVWEGRFGGDESLTRAVSVLRKALAEVAPEVRIETIPKRGYRVVGLYPQAPSDDALITITVRRSALAFGLVVMVVVTGLAARHGPRMAEGVEGIARRVIATDAQEAPAGDAAPADASPIPEAARKIG